MIMPFGKHKGKDLRAIPEFYLKWLRDKAELRSPKLREEIIEIIGYPPTPTFDELDRELDEILGGGKGGTIPAFNPADFEPKH